MVSDYLFNGGIYQFDEETTPKGAVPIAGAAPVPQVEELEEQEADATEPEQETDATEPEADATETEPEPEQDDMEPKKRTAPANKSRKAKTK